MKRLNKLPALYRFYGTNSRPSSAKVGSESPSQFSREYSRLFGAPPVRDITSLRQLAAD
jgi:hypothetical protein